MGKISLSDTSVQDIEEYFEVTDAPQISVAQNKFVFSMILINSAWLTSPSPSLSASSIIS